MFSTFQHVYSIFFFVLTNSKHIWIHAFWPLPPPLVMQCYHFFFVSLIISSVWWWCWMADSRLKKNNVKIWAKITSKKQIQCERQWCSLADYNITQWLSLSSSAKRHGNILFKYLNSIRHIKWMHASRRTTLTRRNTNQRWMMTEINVRKKSSCCSRSSHGLFVQN